MRFILQYNFLDFFWNIIQLKLYEEMWFKYTDSFKYETLRFLVISVISLKYFLKCFVLQKNLLFTKKSYILPKCFVVTIGYRFFRQKNGKRFLLKRTWHRLNFFRNQVHWLHIFYFQFTYTYVFSNYKISL